METQKIKVEFSHDFQHFLVISGKTVTIYRSDPFELAFKMSKYLLRKEFEENVIQAAQMEDSNYFAIVEEDEQKIIKVWDDDLEEIAAVIKLVKNVINFKFT